MLCEELSSNHKILLVRAGVRYWLSRGKILSRFFELKDEVRIYLNERKSEYAQKLHDQNWLQLAAYLADIFGILNEINISLQGLTVHIIKVSDKINALLLKLDMWESIIRKNNVECFVQLNNFLIENELELDYNLKICILEHLVQLKATFKEYFPSETKCS